MKDALRLESLTKSFPHHPLAVNSLSFTVGNGEFKALLGPNGSGKSTTLKMCCNLLEPTSGSIIIDGIDVMDDPSGALSRMGCVIETPSLYKDRTSMETLRYICRLRGMSHESSTSESDRVLEVVGMSEASSKKFSSLSKGMKQRVVIAQALIGEPRILILDEPTSGLDPKGMKELESMIMNLNKEGMSILMSSHMLREVERTCKSYVFIKDGTKVSEGDIGHLENGKGATVQFTRRLTEQEEFTLRNIVDVRNFNGDTAFISADGKDGRARILARIVKFGLPVCGMSNEDELERLFLEVDDFESA